jgi:hypothetical protein
MKKIQRLPVLLLGIPLMGYVAGLFWEAPVPEL